MPYARPWLDDAWLGPLIEAGHHAPQPPAPGWPGPRAMLDQEVWRGRAVLASAWSTSMLYRWYRRTTIDPTVRRRFVRERFAFAIFGLRDALICDRRITREACLHYARRRGWRRAFLALALAAAGLRRLPLIETGSQRVLPILASDGSVADLIGWPAAEPDDWTTRTRIDTALAGHLYEPEGASLRLCRSPASWHAAGGEASAAICLLDATDITWCQAIEGAPELVLDDEAHAAAVDAWLKARRPRKPRLMVAA